MKDCLSPAEVKAARFTLGLSVEQLAKKFGLHWQSIRRWECGGRKCKGPAARALQELVSEKAGAG